MAATAAVQPALAQIEASAEAAVERLRKGKGRLVYAGAGTSGRIGVQDGAELPPTFGWPENRLVLMMAGGPAAFTQAIENAEDDMAAAEREIAAQRAAAEAKAPAATAAKPAATTAASRDFPMR